MKKICWLTSDNFIDVDLPIVNELAQTYEIYWSVVLRSRDLYQYSENMLRKKVSSELSLFIHQMHMRYRSLSAVLFYLKILCRIKKQNPDIIYVDMLGLPYLWILIKMLLPTRKVIYAAHDVEDHVGIPNRKGIQLYKKFIFSQFINFHIFSKKQYAIFCKRYSNKNILLAPLALKNFGKIKTRPTTSNTITFLFFGAIRNNKGLPYLIEAGNILTRKYKGRFKIKIVGSCDLWAYYETMIKAKDVFDIDIRFVPDVELPKLFTESHYLVLPYLDVTQSGPLLVAYNYNLPVIASDLDGFREYIDNGINGFLFEKENSEKLAHVMESAIVEYEKNYMTIKSNLKKFVEENISTTSIAQRYMVYFETLNKKNNK